MKISLKLTLFTVAIMALAIAISCILLLLAAGQNQIESVKNTGAAELHMLNNSFQAEMEAVGEQGMSDTATRSLVLYVFRKYTDASVSGAHYVLTDTTETMFNDSPIDPRPLLPDLKDKKEAVYSSLIKDREAADYPTVIAQMDGRMYLAAGHYQVSYSEKFNLNYEVYLVRDITQIYEGVTSLGLRFALIALTAVLFCAAIMILLIRHTLRPLKGLQKGAFAIAGGDYGKRIEIKGKNEISELALSFNKMADAVALHIAALKDTAEQRKLLLGALTHELKTPMTAIIGYAETLQKVRISREQRETAIAFIHSECRRIERLSQKMMRLIALQGGEAPEMKNHAAGALFEAVNNTLSRVSEEAGISLKFEIYGEPVFFMDMDMMQSVLINLFDNAKKAGAKNIRFTAKEGIIFVSDDGCGIPAKDIEKITQPFYRVDKSQSRATGGSGLGLALCERMTAAHNADLIIESTVNQGTKISILFDNLHFDNGLKNT